MVSARMCWPAEIPSPSVSGHCWFMGSEVSGPEEARAKGQEHLDAGADFLKAMTTGGSTLGSKPYSAAFRSGRAAGNHRSSRR